MLQLDRLLKYFEQTIFRANVTYQLLLFDALAPEQQAFFRSLHEEADFYALLRSHQHPESGIKALDQDAALLFLALQAPGPIPAYVKSQLGQDYHKTILTLVFDKVLEIEWQGTWLSGIEAYELFYADSAQSAVHGTITRLSLEAIKYAQTLELNDGARLSMRLYCYNRLPLSPYWLRKFPTSDSVASHLGLQTRDTSTLRLQQHWVEIPPTSANGWFSWSTRHFQLVADASHFIYKLYISPACEYIRDVFQTTIAVLADGPAIHYKVGKDVYGLLRPDKFVVYFASLEACQNTATVLQQKLAGIPAHGVPFSAEVAGDGLLSWGIDPPPEEQTFSGQFSESWRLWVTNRLAMALLTAKVGQTSTEPWQFALARLQLDGVDTESWTPPQVSWQTRL